MVLSRGLCQGINPYIVFISLTSISAFTLFTLLFSEQAALIIDATRTLITLTASAWYVALAALFLVFCLWIAVSRYGNIRLGADHEKPECSGQLIPDSILRFSSATTGEVPPLYV